MLAPSCGGRRVFEASHHLLGFALAVEGEGRCAVVEGEAVNGRDAAADERDGVGLDYRGPRDEAIPLR